MAGDGILKYTPPSSPNRENSSVHTIDPTTLTQVRLYTFVGAEVRYGNSVFTPYSDPFATLTLKQEDAHDDIFEEIDDYPSNPIPPS
ncbi:hypothetical protein LIER_16758 [Lithospermum erythrorhizon]|uniref:Uncharacterized protein n=1 Tax=Lithospermum erythrorhizon TaxID=34254 RepID=A0AAV3Q864_LITER